MSIFRACSIVVAALLVAIPALGQSVISTHSGLIYYSDGAVSLDGQPLQSHLGTFPAIADGGELRTAQGHAEVLLTPGVFLRVGQNSAIRMVSNDLANTQVEFETGSAILDSGDPNAGTGVTITFKNWRVLFSQGGVFRMDSDPPRLWALKGDVEVVAGSEEPVTVREGMDLPLASVLVPEQSANQPDDDLSQWNKGRDDSVLADNTITQQIGADPSASQSPDLSVLGGSIPGVSYFPFLGLPVTGLSAGVYGTPIVAQPGFASMYLPGYTALPMTFVVLRPGVIGTRFPVFPVRTNPLFPSRIGTPGVIGGVPMRPVPLMPHTLPPSAHPAAPHPIMHPVFRR